jgi:hypothetical protein
MLKGLVFLDVCLPFRIEVKFFASDESTVLPPSNPVVILRPGGYMDRINDLQPVFQDYFPLLLKSDEDKLLGITFYFTYSNFRDENVRNRVVPELSTYLERNGLPITIWINGKYRNLNVLIPPIVAIPPRDAITPKS